MIPTGDRAHATRHAWRPGAGGDTVRVEDIARRLADEARLAAQGRHHLIDPVPTDEDQVADAEVTQPLRPFYTHVLPPLRLAS